MMESIILTSHSSSSLDTMSRPRGSGRGRGRGRGRGHGRGRGGRGQSTPSVHQNGVNGQVAPVPAPGQTLKTPEVNGGAFTSNPNPRMSVSQPSGPLQVQANLRKRKSSAVGTLESERSQKPKDDTTDKGAMRLSHDEREVREGAESNVSSFMRSGGNRIFPEHGNRVVPAETQSVWSASTGREVRTEVSSERSLPAMEVSALSRKRKRGFLDENLAAKEDRPTTSGGSRGKGAISMDDSSLDLSLTVQDYSNLARPIKQKGLKAAMLRGSPKDLTLTQIRARQAELAAFFRGAGAVMVDRILKRGKESVKALEAAGKKEIQMTSWYQDILQQLAMNEVKQMGRIEREREIEQKALDADLAGMIQPRKDQCDVRDSLHPRLIFLKC